MSELKIEKLSEYVEMLQSALSTIDDRLSLEEKVLSVQRDRVERIRDERGALARALSALIELESVQGD